MKQLYLVSLLALLACCPGARADSAKDIFAEQLSNPQESLNTGVKYWIELYRAGKMTVVDSRTQFKSGDKIRFRIVPNVNGYAYVAMTQGSSNQQAVLFPSQRLPNNKVTAGREFVIPATGFLTFDRQLGTERLLLLVARHPVSSQTLLQMGQTNQLMAVAPGGGACAPEVVNNQLLAFPGQENAQIPEQSEESKSLSGEAEPKDGFSKDLFDDAPAPRRPAAHGTVRRKYVIRRARKPTSSPTVRPPAPQGVYIINVEPDQTLGAEILLNHQ